MTDKLNITLVQPDVEWKNIQGNLDKYTKMLSEAKLTTDLILFPEMFQTGFCTEPEEVAEVMNGNTIRWMKRSAETLNCAIAGSLIIRENRHYFNRMVYIDQYENLTWYDKRHLYSIHGEEKKYTAGMQRVNIPVKNWQVNFQICYDLRFPVWARNRNDYDVLVYLANWPAERNNVWSTLLAARAIENQSYVIGVNRVGKDANNISYIGSSRVIDPEGTVIAEMQASHEGLLTVTLSWDALEKIRNEFPVWKDRDNFEI